MQILRGLVATLFLSAAVFGQAAPARVEFEVASIRPAGTVIPGQVSIGLRIDGAQVRCSALSIKDYIAIAYRVRPYQISGPDWISGDRFDLAAKLPDGSKREQVLEMLQNLLADRFQMKLHRETKEFAVYALTPGKGDLKIKESPALPETEAADPGKNAVGFSASGGRAGVTVNLGPGSYFAFANNKIESRRLTMASFADTLGRFMDKPVVNMTDLPGIYDFDLNFSPEDYTAMLIRSAIAAGVVLPPEALRMLENSTSDSLVAAVQAVGLKLEGRKAPIEVLVLDHIEKTPTEN